MRLFALIYKGVQANVNVNTLLCEEFNEWWMSSGYFIDRLSWSFLNNL